MLNLLEHQIDRRNPADYGEPYRPQGQTALAGGKSDEGLDVLRLAEGQSSNPLTVESLGTSALGWEPQQSWLEASLILAESDLASGENAKAAPLIEALSRQWRNADPDLPAANRLRALAGRLKGGS